MNRFALRAELARAFGFPRRRKAAMNGRTPKKNRRALPFEQGQDAALFRHAVFTSDNRPESNHGAGSGDVVGNNANKQVSPPSGIPVKVGVLHSRTGTMAISERAVIDATLFAIEEINAAGGVLGRPVEAVVEDGESDPAVFAVKWEKLIVDDGVCTGHSEQVAKRLRPLAGTGFGF